MKKKLLPLAILAGLAGAAGTAQAAYLSADGTGQALLFPYYTVDGGNFTNINIVNTTNEVKALKVRFLEGENSQEVLDFNLYLSAYDHWAGGISMSSNVDDVARPDGAPASDPNFGIGDGESPGKIAVLAAGANPADPQGETSCTAPEIGADGVDFVNYAYAWTDTGQATTDGNRSMARTHEGYVEVIEMGVLGVENADGTVTESGTNTFGAAGWATHSAGVPANCDGLRNAWKSSGEWGVGGTGASRNIVPPTGGLYGYASIIDVMEGTSASYDAVAIGGFTSTAVNTDTGSVNPSMLNADEFSDVFYDDGSGIAVVSDSFSGNSADAVSSLFMRDTLSNDYVLDSGIAAETDWVITMPTKRFYSSETTLAARAPFSAMWDGDKACEHINVTYWDRDEGTPTPEQIEEQLDFSPLPPQLEDIPDGFNLCTEVSIMTFNGSSVLDSSDRLTYNLNLADGFVDGWASIDLSNAVPPGGNAAEYNARQVVGDNNTYIGLPVTGFAIQKYQNGKLEVDGEGILSNYAGAVEHKYSRQISN
ncbi:hypothetical protein [Gilvimarinus japonicus]|uniref:Uncharacterized protein n=1 Tax=Gilvimarinus japonicus TaxID=1796469 RepID=A0ABV7HW20_9GAMM